MTVRHMICRSAAVYLAISAVSRIVVVAEGFLGDDEADDDMM